FSRLYEAYGRGEESPLGELELQYGDYAVWQREWLKGERLERQVEYWREQLAEVAVLELPTDHARPAVMTHRGRTLDFEISEELGNRLRELSCREGLTLFMTLLTGFTLLLSRHSGQDDISVGTPVGGRRWIDTEEMVGLLVNTLVLRTRLNGTMTLRDLLKHTKETVLQAFEHQELPFERLVEELQPERDASRNPLFQVWFNMLSFPWGVPALHGLTISGVQAKDTASKFDLSLYVHDLNQLLFRFLYNADLFDQARIHEFCEQYRLLLSQIAEAPELPIHHYSLVTSHARSVLPDLATVLSKGCHESVVSKFMRQAKAHPDRVAVIDNRRTWTYEALDIWSNRIALQLVTNGLSGGMVAIYGYRSAALISCLLGVWKANAAFLILDFSYPSLRLARYMEMARPDAFIHLRGAGDVPDEVENEASRCPLNCRIELQDEDIPPNQNQSFLDADILPHAPGPDSRAYVIFTSGSTGEPKGVVGTHGPIAHFVEWYSHQFSVTAADRYTLFSGLGHDPLLRDIFVPLSTGGAVCVPDEKLLTGGNPAKWIAEHGVTFLHLTPALGQLIAESAQGQALPSLRYACFGGDVLTGNQISTMRGIAPSATCVNFYGATETPQAIAWWIENEANSSILERAVLPIGKGIANVQLLVLTPAGNLAGIGELGEIHVRTPYLCEGYVNNPDLTGRRFLTNPFTNREGDRIYKTGDAGRYRTDGAVEFAGRLDQQVKIRGFRIELGEVEAALRDLGASHVVAMVREDHAGEKELVAYVTGLQKGFDPAKLRARLQKHLPGFMVPAAIVVLETLPLTPNGKVDRKALLPPKELHRRLEGTHSLPQKPLEEILLGIWAEVLQTETIGIDDNFFHMGGHSLLLTQVASRIRAQLKLNLPLRTLFDFPTVREFAREVESNKQGEMAPAFVHLERGLETVLPLSYAQQRLWFLAQLQPESGAYNMPFVLKLKGRLDKDALQFSLHEIVRRHEILRTCFPVYQDVAVQEIAPQLLLRIEHIDLRRLGESERETAMWQLRREEAEKPFDLSRGPLVRSRLLQFSEYEHLLLLTTHHIVSDGWSKPIMAREIAEFYRARISGESPRLPELTVQYADFAVWQREWLNGPILERQLKFWSQQLQGLSDLELPTDYLRLPGMKHSAGTVLFSFSNDLTQKLKNLGRSRGVTLFMVLISGFQVLLGWFAGSDDVAVGTDIANRNVRETEGLIGFFVNQLLLRIDLSGNPAFTEVLKRASKMCLEAYAHQDVPFDRLVEALVEERDLNRSPLIEVKLVLHNMPSMATAMPEVDELHRIEIEEERASPSHAKFDLLVTMAESVGRLQGAIDYRSELFERSTIERLQSSFELILEIVTAHPKIDLDSLKERLEVPEEQALRAVSAARLENVRRKKVCSTST
ncbi:MAG TPA: amino acid adenylation domain-containing protein, partial [Candidatus Angelobacter sp.]